MALNPRTTTVDVQFGFTQEDALSSANACMLMAGQPFELTLPPPDVFAGFSIWLYAASNIVVDCLWC